MPSERRSYEDGKGGLVSIAIDLPDGVRPSTFVVLGHGAGNDLTTPLLVALARGLAEGGHAAVRFNFPYKERRGRAPDPGPVLEGCYLSVVEQLRADFEPERLVLGGKSMGGRIASQIAAECVRPDGLLFLGYPLHPAGRPQRLRTAHLARIRTPMLFFAGTRDPLCRLDLLRGCLRGLRAPVTLRVIDDGDHSFRVRKRSGRTDEDILDEIIRASLTWLQGLRRNPAAH